jgi:preprotein translocase subunit SecA
MMMKAHFLGGAKAMKGFLGKLFDSNAREINRMQKTVDRINSLERYYQGLTDDELRAKTEEFRRLLAQGKSLDDLLPDAFATVREASQRVNGQRPFDVQLLGGIALHQGRIAEMKTGEGKTLVATLPAYLNALSGKAVHVITVNDYLARFHSEWMGQIYRFLGLKVGLIVQNMDPSQKKDAYTSDVIYGTNNEFGFDYLRDNMALDPAQAVQGGLYYAIIDEVDSILIDEARTPLIISGRKQSGSDVSGYVHWKRYVESLVRNQRKLIDSLLRQIEKHLGEGDMEKAAELLTIALRGDPRNLRLLEIRKIPGMNRAMDKVRRDYGKELIAVLDERLHYRFEEDENSVYLSSWEAGSLADSVPEIKAYRDYDPNTADPDDPGSHDKNMALYEQGRQHMSHIETLIKAYALFQKDVAYVVQDGKVIIVDEFTGRLMHGRRYSQGLHQAIEAKEGVKVEDETRTMASITIQNYFRMYEKLAGMTGTAETEEEEFRKIYNMEVVVLPTNMPMIRADLPDVIYKTEKMKFEKVVDEISERHKTGQPILVGTVSIEKSERLSAMLKKKGIKHQVLNAKLHEQEAEIVAQAGRPGTVTIATNMAGRGTDILLGGNPEYMARRALLADGADPLLLRDINLRRDPEIAELRRQYEEKLQEFSQITKKAHAEVKALGGLHIIGTERHESRRIDNQLRGRAGRQGDPGSSRFYMSLEDDLMRLYGGDMMYGLMDKLGVEEDMPIEHSLLTSAIERAQRRVETRNFEMRKHVLDYDDVLNLQRDIIYAQRRKALTEDLSDTIENMLTDVLGDLVTEFIPDRTYPEEWNVEGLRQAALQYIPIVAENAESWREYTREGLREHLIELGGQALTRRERELGSDLMRDLERHIVLRMVDEKWMDHLEAMEDLRRGIGLRAYGQRDPLIEYKTEGYEMFQRNVIEELKQDVVRYLFRAQVVTQPGTTVRSTPAPQVSAAGPVSKAAGRNDPCPCGSGKKFKKCCGKEA